MRAVTRDIEPCSVKANMRALPLTPVLVALVLSVSMVAVTCVIRHVPLPLALLFLHHGSMSSKGTT